MSREEYCAGNCFTVMEIAKERMGLPDSPIKDVDDFIFLCDIERYVGSFQFQNRSKPVSECNKLIWSTLNLYDCLTSLDGILCFCPNNEGQCGSVLFGPHNPFFKYLLLYLSESLSLL